MQGFFVTCKQYQVSYRQSLSVYGKCKMLYGEAEDCWVS